MKIVFRALIPVHKLKICHGAIKLENLLIKVPEEIDSLKMTDFGYFNFFKSKFE